MPSPKDVSAAFGNSLLSALPRDEYERLSPHMELVSLKPGRILYHAGDAVRHAYFPLGGMLCLLSTTEDGRTIEVAMIGAEGMAGVPIILGCEAAPYQVMAQLAGNALRIKACALRAEFPTGSTWAGRSHFRARPGRNVTTGRNPFIDESAHFLLHS